MNPARPSMRAYDAVIVGAGPGGSTAASHMALAGRSVLLVDRARFPRDKACGDFVSPRCLDELARLGMAAPSGYSIKREYVVGWPAPTQRQEVVMAPEGLVCPRTRFDDALRRHALSLGVDWLEGYTVHGPLLEDSRVVGVHGVVDEQPLSVEGALVIAADGAAAYLAKRMDLAFVDPDCVEVAGRAYFEGVAGLEDAIEIYPRPDMGLHYGWVFPAGEGIANVGVGATFRQCRAWRLNLRQAMMAFLKRQQGVAQRFGTARQISPFRGAEIRAGRIGSPACAPGILFVGDAASASDPVSGEGIRQAMITGRLAAETAAEALRVRDTSAEQLVSYQRRLDAIFGNPYRESVARMRADVPLYDALRRLMPPTRERSGVAI